MAKKRILVVEDEHILLALIQDTLKRDGFEVLEAANAKEGLALAMKTPPDLAIIDIGLPDLNGWELCSRLKKDAKTRDVVLVVLSGQVSNQDGPLMKKHSVTYIVRKPYDIQNLGAMLRSLLDGGAQASSRP